MSCRDGSSWHVGNFVFMSDYLVSFSGSPLGPLHPMDALFDAGLPPGLFLGVWNNDSVSGEALLYCVGALKFLSGNSEIVRLLLDNNCVAVAQKLIKRLCTTENSNFTMAGYILVQVQNRVQK